MWEGIAQGCGYGRNEQIGNHYCNNLYFKMWSKTYRNPQDPHLSLRSLLIRNRICLRSLSFWHSEAPASASPHPTHSLSTPYSWLSCMVLSVTASRYFSLRGVLQVPGRDDKWAWLPRWRDCPETQPGACTMQQRPNTKQVTGRAMGLDRGHCCRNKIPFETRILGYRQLCLIRVISK